MNGLGPSLTSSICGEDGQMPCRLFCTMAFKYEAAPLKCHGGCCAMQAVSDSSEFSRALRQSVPRERLKIGETTSGNTNSGRCASGTPLLTCSTNSTASFGLAGKSLNSWGNA